MYGDKMEKIRFQICEKELTLYPAQGENRPLIVFNTVMGDGEELAQAMSAAVEAGSGCYGRSGCLSGDIGVGNRAGSQEKNPGKRAVRRHRRVFAGWAFCALCDVPLRLLRVGGQHVRLPVVSEVPGIRASA